MYGFGQSTANPTTSAYGAPDYQQSLQEGFKRTMDPVYHQALTRLQQETGGSPFALASQEESNRNQNNLQANQASFAASQVGQNRFRDQQQRQFFVTDRDKQYAYLRAVQKQQEAIQAAQQKGKNTAMIGSGIGQIASAFGPVGQVVGMGISMVGNQIGSQQASSADGDASRYGFSNY